MATTFKFGNKNWAVKEDYVLAYNDENNNFKPLPFDFTRATTATYVDSDGLIKTANSGYARIDYKDNTDGHLLLEPSRTNLITDSNDPDSGGSRTSKTGTAIKFADGITDVQSDKTIRSSGTPYTYYNNITLASNTAYTFSVFVRKTDSNPLNVNHVKLATTNRFPANDTIFSLDNGTIVSTEHDNATITAYNDGWYRISITEVSTSAGQGFNFIVYPSTDSNGTTASITATGQEILYTNGYQLEAGSYLTSYIPTEGSSVTRNADIIEQSGFQGKVMNATQGTIFIHFNNPIEDGDNNDFHMFRSAGGSGIENGFLFRLNTGTGVDILERVLNSTGAQFGNIVVKGQENKIAISFTSSTFLCSGNGVTKSYSGTYLGTKINIDEFQTSGATLQGFDIIDMKFYNTALTQEEINALTQL